MLILNLLTLGYMMFKYAMFALVNIKGASVTHFYVYYISTKNVVGNNCNKLSSCNP